MKEAGQMYADLYLIPPASRAGAPLLELMNMLALIYLAPVAVDIPRCEGELS